MTKYLSSFLEFRCVTSGCASSLKTSFWQLYTPNKRSQTLFSHVKQTHFKYDATIKHVSHLKIANLSMMCLYVSHKHAFTARNRASGRATERENKEIVLRLIYLHRTLVDCIYHTKPRRFILLCLAQRRITLQRPTCLQTSLVTC
jgi:hypothetical protein